MKKTDKKKLTPQDKVLDKLYKRVMSEGGFAIVRMIYHPSKKNAREFEALIRNAARRHIKKLDV